MTPHLWSGAGRPQKVLRAAYLIHFADLVRGCRHYIGLTNDFWRRWNQHCDGDGSQITRLALQAGTALYLVRNWLNVPAEYERQLKRKKSALLCPICNPTAMKNADEYESRKLAMMYEPATKMQGLSRTVGAG